MPAPANVSPPQLAGVADVDETLTCTPAVWDFPDSASLPARIADWAGVGTTYYVDQATGSDSNTETQAQSESTPWATIMKAVGSLVIPASGHVRILVKNGTYRAAGNSNAVQATVNFFNLSTRTPSADHVLIIENYPGHTPVVEEPSYTGATPTTSERHGFWFDDSSAHHIRIRGFEVRPNGSSVALNQCQGFRIDATTTDVEIDDCHIHGWNASGGGTDPRSQGIFVSNGAARVHVYDTVVRDIGDSANEAANLSHGFYLGGSDHALVNCLAYDNRNGFGVQFYEGGGGGTGHVVTHLVTANNKKSGVVVDGTFAVDIRNSIFYDNDEWAVSGRGSATITVRNSISNANGLAGTEGDGYNLEGTATIDLSSNLTSDPSFVDFAGRDFHLNLGSPAYNAGVAAFTPTTDLEGRSRSVSTLGVYRAPEEAATYSGVVSVAPTVSVTTVGTLGAKGATSLPIVVTVTTAGAVESGATTYFGATSLTLTAAATTTGKVGAKGSASLPVVVSVGTEGTPTAKSSASLSLAANVTTVGKLGAKSSASLPIFVSVTTAGTKFGAGDILLVPAGDGSLTLTPSTSGALTLSGATTGSLSLPAADPGDVTLTAATDGSITLDPA